jgi:hypothetical protein
VRRLHKGLMQRFRFPLAVALTSVGLVLGLVLIAGLMVGSALASSPLAAVTGHAGPPWTWSGEHDGFQRANLPPELSGLADIPSAERFAHFRGVQLQLSDKNNQPVTLNVIPGTATAVNATSLTMAANDGSTQTFAIDASTMTHAGQPGSKTGGLASLSPSQDVVVVTMNGSRTAFAVVAIDPSNMGPHGVH